MSGKPVFRRALAVRDVEEVVGRYLDEQAWAAAEGFIAAAAQAYAHIGRHPSAGSARHAQESGIPGLRSWPIKRYGHLVLYVEHADIVEVWRVLHPARDIPARLLAGDQP